MISNFLLSEHKSWIRNDSIVAIWFKDLKEKIIGPFSKEILI